MKKQIISPDMICTLGECVHIVEEYNKKHKTRYTYGNFPNRELFIKKKARKQDD